MSKFYLIANYAGLQIPNNELECLREYNPNFWTNATVNITKNGIDIFSQMCEFFLNYKANGIASKNLVNPIIFECSLPQHHGLSTRVLDWTSSSRIAAFFAAYCYLKNKNESKATDISVCAIKLSKSNGLIRKIDNHPRYENKFLHAQEGIFTGISGDIYFWNTGKWPSIEQIYKEHGKEYFEIKKIVLSVKCAEDLLKRLEHCGISISKMMPNYNHVAEQVKFISL